MLVLALELILWIPFSVYDSHLSIPFLTTGSLELLTTFTVLLKTRKILRALLDNPEYKICLFLTKRWLLHVNEKNKNEVEDIHKVIQQSSSKTENIISSKELHLKFKQMEKDAERKSGKT